MNEKQLIAILEFKTSSENQAAINSRMIEIKETGACDRFLTGTCDNCNACEIVEVLENQDDY